MGEATSPTEAAGNQERRVLDTTVDLLVVGSGTGLAAALTGHEAGLDVLIIESTEYVGGSTALSGVPSGFRRTPSWPTTASTTVPSSATRTWTPSSAIRRPSSGAARTSSTAPRPSR
ncbi:FAD-binding protein [Nigerium massiliense]|uniref:FAD-binding protein n=1 Tax=Nigerium massiliense TaxID=1522317 RepID=UPI001C481A5F